NKFAFVDGTCVKSGYAARNVLSAQWDSCNAVVLTWIMNYVSADVYMGLVYSVDVANVWKDLESTYDKVDGSIIFNLLQKISSIKQGGSSLADYYHMLNSLWNEFDALTKLSLLISDPLSEVKDAHVIVSKEESHRGIPESSSLLKVIVNDILKNDIKLFKSTDVSACEVYHRAKQTREPFPLCDHNSKKVGDLIHLDLWGLYRAAYLCLKCDKFTSRSDKCVLLGYSTSKKAYKLFSLDRRNVIWSRDVSFYETIFPFKMRNTSENEKADADCASDADHLTFFDNQIYQSPYDERRVISVVEGSPTFSRTDNSQLSENGSATQVEDTSLSEGNVSEKSFGSLSVPTHNLTFDPIDR
ncbi:ribonuclease H-like domain-containing protein, partial [Tanacetum coccineum]